MTSRSDAEGIEVVNANSGPWSDLEYNGRTPPKYLHHAMHELDTPHNAHDSDKIPSGGLLMPMPQQDHLDRRICCLHRRTFWLIMALLILAALAAAIGGGVGGSLANQRKASTATFSVTSSITQSSFPSSVVSTAVDATLSTNTPPPTSSLNTPTFTSTLVGPSATLFRDCPSSNDTIYTVQLGSAEQQFRKECNSFFPSTKSVNDNFVNQFTTNLDDCINLCAQWNVNDHKSPSGLPQTCSVVCWRGNWQNDHPGSCFGYAVTSSSNGTFESQPDEKCDSAVWISQPE